MEVNLCGHATLATAHILWSEDYVATADVIAFDTLSGGLKVTHDEYLICLDFPREDISECKEPIGLEMALGCEIINTYLAGLNLLIEVKDEETVRDLAPYTQQLELLPAELVLLPQKAVRLILFHERSALM